MPALADPEERMSAAQAARRRSVLPGSMVAAHRARMPDRAIVRRAEDSAANGRDACLVGEDQPIAKRRQGVVRAIGPLSEERLARVSAREARARARRRRP